MKFEEYTYTRPNIDEIEKEFNQLIDAFNQADTAEEQIKINEQINAIRNHIGTMFNLVTIRHSIDTEDDFYKNEQDYIDDIDPVVEGLTTKYYQALLQSRFRQELETKWGTQLFALAEKSLKTFDPEIIPLLQRENKLSTEYTKLIASAKIQFEGEERTLAQLAPYAESADRSMRIRANEARFGFMADNEDKLDQIYDDLVKVRTEIAAALGYQNFVELGYDRMNRTDYNAEMVANFRRQVEELIVPIAAKLKERQRNRIGVETLKYYDEEIQFQSGNAKPQGKPGMDYC